MSSTHLKPFIPKGIVIHAMGESVEYAEGTEGADEQHLPAIELLRELRLSVHRLINPDGHIQMMLPDSVKGSHAGISKHGEWHNLNDYFLGVELLVSGHHDYNTLIDAMAKQGCYTESQLHALISLCHQWMVDYSIPLANVVGHQDAAGDDIRGTGKGKLDPGTGFPWDWFLRQLSQRLHQVV